MGEFVDARVQQPKAIHEQIGDDFSWKESDPVLVYTKDDDLHSLVLRYRYNIDMEPEIHILSDGNKVLADSQQGKMIYEGEEFILSTPEDKKFASKLLLYENHDLLEKILDQIDKFFISNRLIEEVKDSTNTKGIKEYIAMKHDPRIQEILRGQK